MGWKGGKRPVRIRLGWKVILRMNAIGDGGGVMNTIADLLTIARGIMVVLIVLIGGLKGVDALPAIIVLTVACWVTDVLDGQLARKSIHPTRLGRYDVVADLGLSLSLAVCLVLWGIIPVLPVVIVVLVVTISTRVFHFLAPQKFAMGMAYAGFMLSVWQIRPAWTWFIFGGLVLLIFLNPQRARQQVVDFLNEVGALFIKHKAGIESDPRQGKNE